MKKYKNYKTGMYRFSQKKRDYSFDELRKYFFIDGSEVLYCKKDFGIYEAGKYYLISNGDWYGCDFVIHEQNGYDTWYDCEYMKET